MVGYGFIAGHGHLPAYLLRDDVEIVAVCDIVPARQEAARRQNPAVRTYAQYRELLDREALDFVDIAAPVFLHADMIHAALDKGLHVLCEKPLTATLAAATSVLSHAQSAGRVLFPCHNYKHAPVVKAIREVLKSGAIGKVRSVTLSTFRNTHALGVPEWNSNWRRFREFSGGGIAMDHGSHSYYLTFEWLQAYPTAITASMSNLQPDRYDTEDNFSAVLTFPTGLAHLHLSWTAGVRKVIYTIQGDQGAITVDDDDMQIARMKVTADPAVGRGAVTWDVTRRSISSDWMDSSHVGWFNSMFDRFLAAIWEEDWLNKEVREAWLCIEAITRAYASAADGSREQKILSPPRF